MIKPIYYKDNYKYQLKQDYSIKLPLNIPESITLDFISLTCDGYLFIKSGYAWDGPSGPTIDTSNFMRGSLVHDALYQLMREGNLPQLYKVNADKILHDLCVEDGMSAFRAWYVLRAVQMFGHYSVDPAGAHPVLAAPL